MSDLAPFVAASLRDRVIDDLLRENEKLFQRAGAIEVTGPTGSIVYTTGHLDKGKWSGGSQRWFVELQTSSSSLACCRLADVSSIQIWLGGMPIQTLENAECFHLDFLEGSFDDETKMGLYQVEFHDSLLLSCMSIRVGPFPSLASYEELHYGRRRFRVSILQELVLAAAGNNVEPESTWMVSFESIEFRATGVSRQLTSLGIPTLSEEEKIQMQKESRAVLATFLRGLLPDEMDDDSWQDENVEEEEDDLEERFEEEESDTEMN